MTTFHWIVLSAFIVCVGGFLYHLLHLLKHRTAPDLAEPKGTVTEGVAYSCTVAMMPSHKESAYKHLPTYTAGILFHISTFTALLLLFVFFFYSIFSDTASIFPENWTWISYLLSLILAVGSICGIAIFIKRMVSSTLKMLSNIDDYVANILTVALQISTIITLLSGIYTYEALTAAVVLLYMPFSKLRHVFYFFAARIELGIFYGKRGVWNFRKK